MSEPWIEPLAGALGSHALAVFAVALVVVWLGVATLWWSAARWLRDHGRGARPPVLRAVLRFALGFAVIVGAALLFASIADDIGADDEIGRFDDAFTAALAQHVGRGTLQVFAQLTRLGDPLTLGMLTVAVALLLLWRGQRGLAMGWAGAVVGNALLNQTLKQVFERVRPLHDDGLVLAHGFSFPSGHSSGAVVAYGMLAYLATRTLPMRWHLPAVLAASTLAFGVGSSRVFLRVHFASDVVAGFASGAAWLAVCILGAEALRHLRNRGGSAGDG